MSCECEEKENKDFERLVNIVDYMVTRLKDIEGRISTLTTHNTSVVNQLNSALQDINSRLRNLEEKGTDGQGVVE